MAFINVRSYAVTFLLRRSRVIVAVAVRGDVFPVGACRRYARLEGAVPNGRLVAMTTAQARERGFFDS